MSHPERLSPPGGEPVGAIAKPPSPNGKSSESLAEFAARYGLTQSAARPPLGRYIRDVWQRRTFIWNFASSKSMSMYTSSRLGQLWQVLTPLLNAFIYYLIFGVLLQQKRGVTDYIPFLVTGVFVFSFCQRSMIAGAKSIGNNLSLIRALHFPRASLPFAFVIVELQHLLVAMGVLVVIVVGFGELPTWHWLLLVPALLMQLVFNIGASLVIARMGAFVRDIQQLLPFILRTWFYASGIFFMTAEKTKGHPLIGKLLEFNPGSVYVELVRTSLLGSYRSDLARQGWTHHHLWLYGLGWAVVAFMGGFWYFYRAEERYGRG
ncbi:ABC transporter permease [Actinomadura sp. HBU206391]|uniref:ABC transporter permease n=1 Tax=Actinomadura sp. HBU206391 TaxID=2731692 RepID=UPI00164F5C7E|nr:ABC transporter permease [Actinomadura sp. HBU206391]MBC6460533.1 ABC transporter permease [Actinomadura sp. HBU206391]